MIDQEQRIIELTSLGISVNEAKTYLTLLVKNSMTVNEIAQISGVPRAKLYGVITKLITKGFCIEKVGDIKKYRAVDPNVVVEKLNEIYQQQIEQRKKIAKNFSNSIISFYKKNMSKTDPLEYIEVLKDKKQIGERWLELQKNAKNEILVFNKAPYAIPFTENLNEEIYVLKKKIKYKGIYEYRDIKTESEREKSITIISSFVYAGEEARIVKELPIKLAIFDDKITILALNDPISLKPSITTMIINHPSFAKAQKNVFESIWEKAMSFEEFKNKGV